MPPQEHYLTTLIFRRCDSKNIQNDSVTSTVWQQRECDSESVTARVWQRECDSERVTARVWQQSCDSESVTVRVWQWSCDSESVTARLWQRECNSESVTARVWQRVWQWECDSESVTGIFIFNVYGWTQYDNLYWLKSKYQPNSTNRKLASYFTTGNFW